MIRGRCHAATAAALLALSTPLLASCGAASDDRAAAASAEAAGSEATAADAVQLHDGWAKAGEGMTGVFATLENTGGTDLVLESATSDAAGIVELHETSTSGGNATMREVEGGFEIPAGGSIELSPGGDHIMLMEMPEALLAGDEVRLVLHFDDDSSVEIAVLVKDFAGAQENYEDLEGSEHGDGHAGH